MVEDSKEDEDIPSGFEDQQFRKGNFECQLEEVDKKLNKFEGMKGIVKEIEVFPNQESCFPFMTTNPINSIQSSLDSNDSKSTGDFFENPLSDNSKPQGPTSQVTTRTGPKWIRLPHVGHGSHEKTEVHTGNKRSSDTEEDHRGLPKKKKIGFS